MPILDEPSDERSPLKEDVEINTTSSAALATAESAPPPYTLIPTPSPNPIPPTDLHDLVIFLTQWSTIRRILVTWVVFLLVMVLWSAFVYSTSKTRHLLPIGREYEVESNRQLQGIVDTGRVLPIQYSPSPIQLPQVTG